MPCSTSRSSEPLLHHLAQRTPTPAAQHALGGEMSGMSGETPINACLGASTPSPSARLPRATPGMSSRSSTNARSRASPSWSGVSPRRPGMRWYAKCPASRATRRPTHTSERVDHRWATAAGPSWSSRAAAPDLGAKGLCFTIRSNEPLPRISEQSRCARSRSKGPLLRRLEQRAFASPVEARHRDLHWVPGLKESGPGRPAPPSRVVPHRQPG